MTRFFNPSVKWMLAFFLIVEGALLWVPEGLFTRTAHKRLAEIRADPAPMVQIFGDSVAESGLNENALGKNLQIPAGQIANRAIPGTTVLCAQPCLARQIQSGQAPKVIILAYCPRSYALPFPAKFYGRIASWSEFADARSQGITSMEWLYSLMCRGAFTLRYRQELNGLARTGRGWDFWRPSRTPAVGFSERSASLPDAPPRAQPARKIPVAFNAGFHAIAFHPPPEVGTALGSFFTLAREHGVRVLIVSMPKTSATQAYHEANGLNAAYDRFLAGLRQRYGAEILLREQQALPTGDFSDGVHLTPEAAWRFSEKVNGLLRTWWAESGMTQAEPRRPR